MKISALLGVLFFLQVTAECYSQEITLKLENVTVQKVFRPSRSKAVTPLCGKEQISDIGRVSVSVEKADI